MRCGTIQFVGYAIVCLFVVVSSGEENTKLPSVEEALAANTDIWGEAAIRQPGGSSYDFFAKLLPPLRYVNAKFRHYPIVLSAPMAQSYGRLVSNGSAINAQPDLQWWGVYPCAVEFHVGEDRAVFGEDLHKLAGPNYADGSLPIVQMAYEHGGATYREEVFVSVEQPYARYGAVFVRFSLSKGKKGVVTGQISAEKLTATDGTLRDAKGNTLVHFGREWMWNATQQTLTVSLAGRRSAELVIFSKPMKLPTASSLSAAVYDKQRKRCAETWDTLLRRGARFEIPEPVVQNAWQSLIIGTMMMTRGNHLNYSAGNGYERQFEAECGDAVRALAMFGLRDEARRMIPPLLDYYQEGLGFHDTAFKLQLLSHYFWLTRDAEFILGQKRRWMPKTDRDIATRDATLGLLPKEDYCGDIQTQVHSLNANANFWRGLRDITAVMEDIGDRDDAARFGKAAAELRVATLAAVEKSERRDVKPTFIPIALFGAEQPYPVLTATKMGSYWCLMSPYVLGSGILGDESERTGAILDTLHTRGGVAMGMIRFDQHSGAFANEKGVDDLYSLRYVITLLRRDEVDRALVSFYGKLAQGLTRDTFIGAEGTSLVPLDEFGRPMYLPPNSSSNAHFLWMLRYMLIQDWDMNDDGRPDTLRLLFATPPRWLEDGKTIRVERAPTAFGEISVVARSRVTRGEMIVDVTAPEHPPKQTLLRISPPHGYKVIGAYVGRRVLSLDARGTVDISSLHGRFAVRFEVRRE